MQQLRTFLLDAPAKEAPEQLAFRQGDEGEYRITYQTLRAQAYALGDLLLERGYSGRICIWGGDCYQWVLAHLTVVCGIGTAVALDKNYTIQQVAEHISRCKSSLLLYTKSFEVKAQEVKALLPQTVSVACIDELMLESAEKKGRLYALRQVKDEDIVAIFFTSGTTAQDKGVMLSQSNLRSGACACMTLHTEAYGDSMLSVLPLHHSYSCICGIYTQILFRVPVCFPESLRKLPMSFQMYKPTKVLVVPQILETLMKLLRFSKQTPETFFGGNLKWFVTGGAPCRRELIEEYNALGIQVLEGYGITECAPVISANWFLMPRIGSVGFPLYSVRVQIIDGEICVSGANVFSGYLDDPDATAQAKQNGWFRTGDLGYLDEDGYLYVSGRKKNLIILDNGENVSPEELEALIYEQVGASECLVYEKDCRIVAELYFAEKALTQEEAERLVREMNRSLPMYKQIRRVILSANPLPRNSNGKLLRNRK